MAKQAPTLFLEEWLRSNSGISSRFSTNNSSPLSSRAIGQAWIELRDSLHQQLFHSHHLQSLKALLGSHVSLFVADPQAKLLLTILSSQNIHLPCESYPLFLRLLYIWLRKSTKPSKALTDLTAEVLSHFFSTKFYDNKSSCFLSEGVLLLGALSSVPYLSGSSRILCLKTLCCLLEEEYLLIGSSGGLIPDVLAGIAYALSSSEIAHFVRILDFLMGIWGREGGPCGSVAHGLMILHLIEWVIFGFISSNSVDNINIYISNVLEAPKASYVPYILVMAAAGAVRASTRSVSSGIGMETASRLRSFAEKRIEAVSRDFVIKMGGAPTLASGDPDSLFLQCISLAISRSSPLSFKPPILICLASALLIEIFPLQRFYTRVLASQHYDSTRLGLSEVKEHLGSVLFMEAGSISGAFCNQYVLADEENKRMVESLVWGYCQYIYSGHRQIALLLRDVEDGLLGDLERIAEPAFFTVVVFASAVTKQRLNSKFTKSIQMQISVKILVSFSYLEYFRRVRLPEYMDAIRWAIASVQQNESACISFVESMPSYTDLAVKKDLSVPQNKVYPWMKDEVQTARISFYLRVIPSCIEQLPSHAFRKIVAPTMFLYMGHPNGKIARASHSLFASFISSGKDSSDSDRVLLKEQLVFYYMQRALEGYPEVTPFDGMASGVAALVRNLPAGSPAIFYCVDSLVEHVNKHHSELSTLEADMWKDWEGDSEPSKKILELLIRLILLVDIQVLPHLMKLWAQLISQMPKDGQALVLDGLYAQVAESDDVTRKPTLVSWVQSVYYLFSQATSGTRTSRGPRSEKSSASPKSEDSSRWNRLGARL